MKLPWGEVSAWVGAWGLLKEAWSYVCGADVAQSCCTFASGNQEGGEEGASGGDQSGEGAPEAGGGDQEGNAAGALQNQMHLKWAGW